MNDELKEKISLVEEIDLLKAEIKSMREDINECLRKRNNEKICILGPSSRLDVIEKIAKYYLYKGCRITHHPQKVDGDIYVRRLAGYVFRAIDESDDVLLIPNEDGSIDDKVNFELAYTDHVNKSVSVLDVEQIRLICHLMSVAMGEVNENA